MSLTTEQIHARKRGVGCSELLAALGKDPRVSRLELYKRKVGELPDLDFSDNERVECGVVLEAGIRELFSRKLGHPITTLPDTLFHADAPLVGHPDGLIEALDCGIEFKNRDRLIFIDEYGEDGTDQVPMRDLIQCVGYMEITQRRRWLLGALVGGNERHIFEIAYDEQLAVAILAGVREFWQHVEERRPPAPETSDDVKLLWPKHLDTKVTATPEIEATLAEHAELKDLLKQATEKQDGLSLEIKKFMGEAGELVDQRGKTLATWRANKPSKKFDEKRFAAENQDVYEDYRVDKASVRPFLNKLIQRRK